MNENNNGSMFDLNQQQGYQNQNFNQAQGFNQSQNFGQNFSQGFNQQQGFNQGFNQQQGFGQPQGFYQPYQQPRKSKTPIIIAIVVVAVIILGLVGLKSVLKNLALKAVDKQVAEQISELPTDITDDEETESESEIASDTESGVSSDSGTFEILVSNYTVSLPLSHFEEKGMTVEDSSSEYGLYLSNDRYSVSYQDSYVEIGDQEDIDAILTSSYEEDIDNPEYEVLKDETEISGKKIYYMIEYNSNLQSMYAKVLQDVGLDTYIQITISDNEHTDGNATSLLSQFLIDVNNFKID